jgi:hypothetical protein
MRNKLHAERVDEMEKVLFYRIYFMKYIFRESFLCLPFPMAMPEPTAETAEKEEKRGTPNAASPLASSDRAKLFPINDLIPSF